MALILVLAAAFGGAYLWVRLFGRLKGEGWKPGRGLWPLVLLLGMAAHVRAYAYASDWPSFSVGTMLTSTAVGTSSSGYFTETDQELSGPSVCNILYQSAIGANCATLDATNGWCSVGNSQTAYTYTDLVVNAGTGTGEIWIHTRWNGVWSGFFPQDAYSLEIVGTTWNFGYTLNGGQAWKATGTGSWTITNLTMEIIDNGNLHTAYVNGVLLASFTDSQFPSGGWALTSDYPQKAYFGAITIGDTPPPTPTVTPTSTASPNFTATPTDTPPPTPTVTPTSTASPNFTATPTDTPPPTPTVTPTSTASPTEPPSGGFYDFEQNLNDTSGAGNNGTILGSGPVYITQSPAAMTGAYCVSSTAWSTNGGTLPSTVIPTGSTWSIGVDFYFSNQDSTNTWIPIDSNNTNGRFGLEIQPESSHQAGDGQVGVNVPTTGGGQRIANITWPGMRRGRWLRYMATGSGTTVKLLVKDVSEGVWTVLDTVTLSTSYSPGTAGPMLLGRYVSGTGNDMHGEMDTLLITNQYLPTGDDAQIPVTPHFQWLWQGWGASGSQGYCGTSAANGLRTSVEAAAAAHGTNVYAVGSGTFNIDGTILAPYTDAIAGNNSNNQASRFATYAKLQYETFSAQTDYFIGGDMFLNDVDQGVPLATGLADVDYMVNSIEAFAPSSRIIMDTAVHTVRFTTPTIYETPEVAFYQNCTTLAAAHGNIICSDTWHTQGVTTDCGDGAHPSVQAYATQGTNLYAAIVATVTPTPAPSNGSTSLWIKDWIRLRPSRRTQ